MEAHQIRISVSGTPAGAASARQQIAEWIRAWGVLLEPDLLDTAELVASELITNAVRHAHGPITASAYLSAKALRIAVIDTSSDIPEVGLPDADEEDGRGLFLVAALADRHGFEPLPSGKRCWAEFELSAPLLPVASHLPCRGVDC
ncbi:ATP-binding protein [Streptomyces sp. BPTC-684]|uniref:ATP-binding protein n=1 Tax=Streptomyces sp. BPTC-684 TaxID=3043734 RepID=UPI0024B0C599|nr:ATP-binding protein [Streptomyces sp. BPTC-684]WHM38256.1 ATP-binding protein [Streptomyces sp. BPTC-684]